MRRLEFECCKRRRIPCWEGRHRASEADGGTERPRLCSAVWFLVLTPLLSVAVSAEIANTAELELTPAGAVDPADLSRASLLERERRQKAADLAAVSDDIQLTP